MNEVWQLTITDLTHLGGPMGTEYTTDSNGGVSATSEAAKRNAEKHYNGSRGPIHWQWIEKNHGKGNYRWFSGDLGYVAYSIERVPVD